MKLQDLFIDLRPDERTLEEKLGDFIMRMMTPASKAQIRSVIAQHFYPEPPPRSIFVYRLGLVFVGNVPEDVFKAITGREPQDDDMHRANCPDEGKPGHWMCGWCEGHETFRMVCGCIKREEP